MWILTWPVEELPLANKGNGLANVGTNTILLVGALIFISSFVYLPKVVPTFAKSSSYNSLK